MVDEAERADTRMMEFLHAHHTGEDEGLWPLVRQQNPAAGRVHVGR